MTRKSWYRETRPSPPKQHRSRSPPSPIRYRPSPYPPPRQREPLLHSRVPRYWSPPRLPEHQPPKLLDDYTYDVVPPLPVAPTWVTRGLKSPQRSPRPCPRPPSCPPPSPPRAHSPREPKTPPRHPSQGPQSPPRYRTPSPIRPRLPYPYPIDPYPALEYGSPEREYHPPRSPSPPSERRSPPKILRPRPRTPPRGPPKSIGYHPRPVLPHYGRYDTRPQVSPRGPEPRRESHRPRRLDPSWKNKPEYPNNLLPRPEPKEVIPKVVKKAPTMKDESWVRECAEVTKIILARADKAMVHLREDDVEGNPVTPRIKEEDSVPTVSNVEEGSVTPIKEEKEE